MSESRASNIREILGRQPSRNLQVSRDLSGGVKIKFGQEEIVLSPDDGIGFARAILTALDYDLDVMDFPKLLRA